MTPRASTCGFFFTTFRIAATVTLLTLVIGYPMAGLLLHARRFWQRILMLCIVLPFWTSVLVRTYAWMVLLGRRGVINTFMLKMGIVDQPVQLLFNTTGTVIGMTHIMLPYMIFPLFSVMRNIDPQLISAALYAGGQALAGLFENLFSPQLAGRLWRGALGLHHFPRFFHHAGTDGRSAGPDGGGAHRGPGDGLLQWGLGAALGIVLLFATFCWCCWSENS